MKNKVMYAASSRPEMGAYAYADEHFIAAIRGNIAVDICKVKYADFSSLFAHGAQSALCGGHGNFAAARIGISDCGTSADAAAAGGALICLDGAGGICFRAQGKEQAIACSRLCCGSPSVYIVLSTAVGEEDGRAAVLSALSQSGSLSAFADSLSLRFGGAAAVAAYGISEFKELTALFGGQARVV